MGKIFLIVLIIFFGMILGGLFVVRGIVEELENQGLTLSLLDQLLGAGEIRDQGNNDFHAQYPDYTDIDSTTPPDNIDSTDTTTKEATEAYQDYIEAYNKLTDLMSAGKGDTPEAQQAYEDYKTAKEIYEQIAKALK